MNPLQTYRQHNTESSARIDVVLTLLDQVFDRVQRARRLDALNPGERERLLCEARVLVGGIGAGIDPAAGDVAANLQRLYLFVIRCLNEASASSLHDAAEILSTLCGAFESIRDSALEMERSGRISSLGQATMVQTLA